MLPQDIMLLPYSMINNRGDLLSALFKHAYNFLIKVDDVAI